MQIWVTISSHLISSVQYVAQASSLKLDSPAICALTREGISDVVVIIQKDGRTIYGFYDFSFGGAIL